MGLFDFFKKKTKPVQNTVPQYQLLPVDAVQIHKSPLTSGNIKSMKSDCYVLHFETTGTFAFGDPSDKYTNMITAIKCARFKDMQMVDSFFSLVNPGRQIPKGATTASGIDNQMVASAPTIEQVFPQFMNYFHDALNGTLVLAYNEEFNGDFLKITMRRQMIPGDIRMLDVMKLADKKILTDNYPTIKQAMKASKYKDRELNTDIHKCQAIAKIAFTLVDVPDNSIEVK
jgi:DNA polymerase III epsilon subunit-like protein